MLTENLFDSVLLAPVRQRADTLYIVSGYASATMAHRHFRELQRFRRPVKVELIVGMTVQDGLSAKDHQGFRDLVSDTFSCRYVAYNQPVHTKTFAWYSEERPRVGFSGSANYTQSAFSGARREAMTEHDAEESRDYFDLIRQDTVDCRDPQVANLIAIHAEPEHSIRQANDDDLEEPDEAEAAARFAGQLDRLPHQRISFLNRAGQLPQRSGLNWGQRPEAGREPNQAYIRLTAEVYSTDYFPPRGEQFTILTDDGRPLVCVRAQDHAKAIHTSLNNSDMGRYFRERVGVPLGAPVTVEDLARYGRTDVDFYKIDEETYYMDFSV